MATISELTNQMKQGYHVHGDIKNAQCVIALSFGMRDDRPGLSNEDIAQFALDNYPSLPKIFQAEIADSYSGSVELRIAEHRKSGKYLDTYEVVFQAKKYMDMKNWHTAIVLAHPHHLPRTDQVCQKLGIDTITPAGLEVIRYDPLSSQEWTRNQELFFKHEKIALNYYLVRDWI